MLTAHGICQIRAFMSNCKIKGKSPSSINCNELLLTAHFKIAVGQIAGRPTGDKETWTCCNRTWKYFFLDKALCQSYEKLTLWCGCFYRL